MIRVNVSLANATVTETETLTAGRVGLECGFTFSSEWDGLAKVAVFEGAETIEVALGTASIAVVPPECMATAGYNLRVGVYGLSPSEAVVIPTVWAKAGKIKDSAAPDDESFAPATPELVAQIIEKSDTALSIAQNVAVQAASGAFDGAPGVSPTVESEEITGGHRITITDVTGDTVVDVMDGADGRNGTDGINGTDGSDGVSPEVTITSITGGHRVSITDADHPSGQSFDVMDGASAYEQAVSGGYTGDEEQFNTDLANFKTYAAQTASDATAAEDSATAAGNAQTAAETAQEAAEDAQEAAETAQAAAEAAAASVSESAAQIAQNTEDVADLKSAISVEPVFLTFERGTIDGGVPYNSTKWVRSQMRYATKGSTIVISPSDFSISNIIIYFYDADGTYREASTIRNATLAPGASVTYTFTDDAYFRIKAAKPSQPELTDNEVAAFSTFFTLNSYRFSDINQELAQVNATQENFAKALDFSVPTLKDGSVQNAWNTYMVTFATVQKIPLSKRLVVEYTGELAEGNNLSFQIRLYTSEAEEKSPTDAGTYGNNVATVNLSPNQRIFDVSPYFKGTEATNVFYAVALAIYKPDGTYVVLRASTHAYTLRTEWATDNSAWDRREVNNVETLHLLKNAKQIRNSETKAVTIFHFSDIHGDSSALNRMMRDAVLYGTNIDAKICTGDMVAQSYGSISSWWDKSVMVCIGNHDSASYEGGVYDWDAHGMSDCATTYIDPFVSNWGVTRTAGKTYYYKDFADSAVRLIVLDSQLYIAADQTDATAQNAWLTSLLTDSISNSKHVLIAAHAPHPGATPVDCSFTPIGETIMPSMADSNTPQSVVDIVATAITGGLHFIGYIVGHTHKDDVWDADGDGKQLMYAVTTAKSGNFGAWKYGDQNRDCNQDAYNLVTIDTDNTLVKIVRGGGADTDVYLRPRRAITFNYSTGQKVSEIL